MKSNLARIMLVGTGSGCGKTTVTCALLKALIDRKINTVSFKCGPDYIDPMFHSEIIGTKSRNLDMFLCGENTVKYLLGEESENIDIAVIEGVMGMYDGMGFQDDKYSANHISRETLTPEILVVNVRGKSLSLAAEVWGYINYRENNVKGLILNNCSKGMYRVYKQMLEEKLNIKVFGYMPMVKEAEIGSRNLGLITAAEIDNLKDKIDILGKCAAETLDIAGIVQLAHTAPEFTYDMISIGSFGRDVVNIGVARDKAFCFYYEDNLRLLQQLGGRIQFFSPLEDDKIPDNIDGLIFGGGYPEEYLAKLSQNKSMLESINSAIQEGMPVYAECGGFMYLGESITRNQIKYNMVGAISGNSFMTESLVRFGYKTLTANEDNLMCKKGETIKCHEFHYSDTDNNGTSFIAANGRGKTWQTIVANKNIFAGYPHLHFYSNIDFPKNFINKCKSHRGGTLWI